MTPAEFIREYAQKTNTHRFEEVAPLAGCSRTSKRTCALAAMFHVKRDG